MQRLSILIIILFIFFSCSRKNDKQLFQEGIDAYGRKNFQAAIDNFQEIVDRFPAVAYAESSQYRIAVIYNNDLHEISNAVHAYQKFYSLFPSSPHAATALFLTGFLFNNEMHQTDSAKAAYETFLQKYPRHPLAVSAKYELETLGKDPGLLLKYQTAVTENSKTEESKKSPRR